METPEIAQKLRDIAAALDLSRYRIGFAPAALAGTHTVYDSWNGRYVTPHDLGLDNAEGLSEALAMAACALLNSGQPLPLPPALLHIVAASNRQVYHRSDAVFDDLQMQVQSTLLRELPSVYDTQELALKLRDLIERQLFYRPTR